MEGNSPARLSQSRAQHGDVDEHGEIVDLYDQLRHRASEEAAYARLAAAVCSDEAAIDVDEHIARVVAVVRR